MQREMTYLGKKSGVKIGPPFVHGSYVFSAGRGPVPVDGQDAVKMVESNPKMFLMGKPIYEGSTHEAEAQSDEDVLLEADEATDDPGEAVEETSEEGPTVILVDTNMNGYTSRAEIMDALDKIAVAYPDVDAGYMGKELRAELELKLATAILAVKDLDPDQSIIKV